MVLVHRAAAQLVPHVAVPAERAQRARQRAGERGAVVPREREPVPVPRMLVDVTHRVREAANGPHDGDRAVAQRDELTETARLESRRHEEQIAPRVDALRQCRIEAERQEESRRIPVTELAPPLLVRRVTGPEHDELRATLEQVGRDGREEVHAFLLDEPSDDTQYRRLGVDAQAAIGLKRGLALGLAAPVVRRVRRGDVRIVGRIEGSRVDAIHDPAHVGLAPSEQVLQTLAEFRGEDLLRIARAHRTHDVRPRDRACHRVAFARLLRSDAHPRQADGREDVRRRLPLVREIVDREHRRGRRPAIGIRSAACQSCACTTSAGSSASAVATARQKKA